MNPPYIEAENNNRTISRYNGGNGCINSHYNNHPANRYELDSQIGSKKWKLKYTKDNSDLQEYGIDKKELHLSIEELSNCILRITIKDIADNNRFELPYVLDNSNPLQNCEKEMYNWDIKDDIFGISVSRKDTNEVIFDTSPTSKSSFRNLVFKDKYLEISTKLSSESSIFGLGERISSLELDRNDKIYTLFNADNGTPENTNLYGKINIFLFIYLFVY